MPDGITEGCTRTGLEAAIDAWVNDPALRLDLRFPPPLESMYVTETLDSRVKAMRVSSVAGCVAGLLLAPVAWLALSDARPLITLAWLRLGLPVSLVSQCLVWLDLPLVVQEIQVCAVCLLASFCIAIMASGTAHGATSLLFASMVTMLLIALVGCRISFRVSRAFTPCMVALFTVAAIYMPHQTDISAWLLSMMMAVTSFYALFGTWRLESEIRRNYAGMLRARLGQQSLSARNIELDALARRDPLTGLANRRAYDHWLGADWAMAHASGASLGLIVTDIDSFKLYNDFYGHPAGDVCLQTVATSLREQLRDTTDLIARIGGEEFAIILPGVTLATCGDIAERLRQAVEQLELPHFGIGTAGVVTISLGAASFLPQAGDDVQALSEAADRALYAAKQGGRNRVFLAGADTATHPPVTGRHVGAAEP